MKTPVIFVLFLSMASDMGLSAQNIYRTACQGNLMRLDSLLKEVSVNEKDNRGRNLLHWAVACKKKKVFDFLIEKGIDINATDNEGATPLYMAVRFQDTSFFHALVDLQSSHDWKNTMGPSLMEKAILNKDLSFVKTLIESGININAPNKRGSTPLEISLRTNEMEISDWLVSNGADRSAVRTFQLKGEYLGQPIPGHEAAVFAPNNISTEESEFGSVFTADGTEFYYGVDVNGKNEIRYTHQKDYIWSAPVTILSHEQYSYNDPFLSPDEQRLYFISDRPLDGEGDPKDIDIWYVERTNNSWTQPINAGPNINSERNEYYISFTRDGTMYFSSNANAPEERSGSDFDIYYSRYLDGAFQKPVVLGPSINTTAYEADVFVDPDESYMIFCAMREEGLGRGDLYISYKNPDGSWTKSINMGKKVNSASHELCPFVSSDGKYLFFTSNQDIYWMSSDIIKTLRE